MQMPSRRSDRRFGSAMIVGNALNSSKQAALNLSSLQTQDKSRVTNHFPAGVFVFMYRLLSK